MKLRFRNSIAGGCAVAFTLQLGAAASLAADNEDNRDIEEIEVIGITPISSQGREARAMPFSVQSVSAQALEESLSLDLSDFMNNNLASVTINSAQNNPLQPDVQFRGFTASPLLGLPQGLAVYQNGVRINEPLGDAVNWDLLPESAVHSMDLISGANPVFGLNTLGGALSIRMKNGFNYEGHGLEAYTGSWDRRVGHVESGGNNGQWGYYVNLSHFEEDGWRDLSDSEAGNVYGSLSWRGLEGGAVDLMYQQGDSELTGNGALPVGLLARDREAIFTAPDITENDMRMVNLQGSFPLSEAVQFSGNLFARENETDSFNGDASEFEACRFAGGDQALLEEADEIEDALEDALGIDLDDICEGEVETITGFDQLQAYIDQQAGQAGLDPEEFELEDVTDQLSGTGILSDEAINNTSRREQESEGFNVQLSFNQDFLGRDNELIIGASYFTGESDFISRTELSRMNPRTRSTAGLGVGTFVDTAATDVWARTTTRGWYLTDTLQFTDRLSVTLAGRYNDSDVVLRDRSGVRPELNGDHDYSRFNPAAGFTWQAGEDLVVYGSYSESNRIPTPIELACNEGVFELAREYAAAAGEDPDDIDFECRLPNAFLADPPLEDVVTHSTELGVRGVFAGVSYRASLFHAINKDDILFQTTGRATGLFANVDETRRQGFESRFNGSVGALDWQVAYSYIQATFGDDFMVLSPNHPGANDDGQLAVDSGDRLPGLPEHVLKLRGDYRLAPGLRIGAEAIYNSDQYLRGDESNELEPVDGYALLNLHASYALSQQVTVFARVTNALDTEYENFGLLGEDPGEVVDLADQRPRFLGVGAPRGAWLGVRARF